MNLRVAALAVVAAAGVGIWAWALPYLWQLAKGAFWLFGAGFLAWQVAHFVVGPLWVFVWLFALLIVWLIGPLRWVVLAVVVAFRMAGA